MEMQPTGLLERMTGRQLSQIREVREGSEVKDDSVCLFPTIPGPESNISEEDPTMLILYQHQRKLEDNRSLLEELARIEQELREKLRFDAERDKVAEAVRKEDNRIRWENLCHLNLNQRINKPWVTSYYRNIPMHIYCLPIQSKAQKRIKNYRRMR